MQRQRIVWMAALVLGMSAASGAWGSFDSPQGEPPFGVQFADGRSGQSYEGVVTTIFEGYNDLTLSAAGFKAVARLRKGGELHVFYEAYSCAAADPCAICTAPGTRIDVTEIGPIQLCLQDRIAAEVIADYGLGAVDVRLKDMSDFVSEIDPSDPSVRAVAADVVVTVK